MANQHPEARLTATLLITALLYATTSACSSSSSPAPSATSFSEVVAPYVGAWVNDDSHTRGITRILVDHAANIHPFGACHPDECDWNSRIGELRGSEIKATFVFPEGAPTHALTLTMVGNRLKVSGEFGEETFHKAGPEAAIPTALLVDETPTP